MMDSELPQLAHASTSAPKKPDNEIPEPIAVTFQLVSHSHVLLIADDVIEKWSLLNPHPFKPDSVKCDEIQIGVYRPDAIVGGLWRKRRNQPLLVSKK